MQGQRDKVTFDQNVPVTVTLQYPQGKIVSGRFGEQVMYGLMGNQIMFLDLGVAQKINNLEIQAGESVVICKRTSKIWDVWLTPGTEKMRALRAAPAPDESPVMAQMRGTLENIQEGKPPATPRVPVSISSGASVSAPAPEFAGARTATSTANTTQNHSNPMINESNDLVDVLASVMERALTMYGGRLKPDEIKSCVITVYIERGKRGKNGGGKYAAA